MSLDKMIIRYCAPALCGIKASSMFFIKNQNFQESIFQQWKKMLFERGFMSFAIPLSESSTGILISNVCWVRKILEDPFVQAYLSEKDYHCNGLFEFVDEFSNRVNSCQGFPHEIGVILGYPIEDVIEFENHQGRNCKYCGIWKSYSNTDDAKDFQCRYKNCCGLCERLYNEGYSLEYIINEYKKTLIAA